MRTDHWYDDTPQAAEFLQQTIAKCSNDHRSRRRNDALFCRMYGLDDMYGAGVSELQNLDPDKLRFNLVRAVTKTAQAHIGTIRPKPKFQTNDGDWSLSRKAKKCEDAVRSIFYDQKYHKLSSQVFIDACVNSLGAIKVYAKDGKVHLERVFPGEILVDLREAYHGQPKNLYQCKLVDKDLLIEQYPSKKFLIESNGSGDLDLFSWIKYDISVNQVLVVEAWHLPDSNGKGGRHTIAIRNAVLFSEEWTRDSFPFAFYRWETRQAGFYGMGIVEELRTAQQNLNAIDIRINRMMRFASVSKIVIPRTGKINTEELDNDSERVVTWSGQGPQPTVWRADAVPNEWWQERQRIIEFAFQQIGVNRMQMSGEKPPGIQAAIALRELNDVGSKRFRQNIYEFEQLSIDTAVQIIACLKDMAEKGTAKPIKAKVKKRTTTLFEDIDWAEVALDPDEYRLEVQSASSLPDSTPGRTQTVQDWYSAGFINQLEAKQLLQFTDIEGFQNLDLAPYHVVLDNIESIIEDGIYRFPEPTDDLDLSIKLAGLSYSKFRLRNAPVDRLELLLQYIDDVKYLQEQALAGASHAQQLAAGITPAVTGMRQQLPGGGTSYEAAKLLESAGAMGQGGGGGGPMPALPPGQQQGPPQL